MKLDLTKLNQGDSPFCPTTKPRIARLRVNDNKRQSTEADQNQKSKKTHKSKLAHQLSDTNQELHKYFQKVYGDAAFKRYQTILLNKNKLSAKDLLEKHGELQRQNSSESIEVSMSYQSSHNQSFVSVNLNSSEIGL